MCPFWSTVGPTGEIHFNKVIGHAKKIHRIAQDIMNMAEGTMALEEDIVQILRTWYDGF